MQNKKILWADDEIEHLKPHILFLEGKNFKVDTVNNGLDAIQKCISTNYDLVFLDENMPGIGGLETLKKIKENKPSLPVVMITKNEAEQIMEEAIGQKIADYLIKPVNPNQILLATKKILENKRIQSERAINEYQQDFRQISLDLLETNDIHGWINIYKKLVKWDLDFSENKDTGFDEVFENQQKEANQEFSKFIQKKYESFLALGNQNAPIMSHTLFEKKLKPLIQKHDEEIPIFFLLMDNLRYDQWKILQSTISSIFNVDEESLFLSILPTTTQYSRNAIFAGLTPLEIAEKYPALWSYDEEEGGKNNHEQVFLNENFARLGLQDVSRTYHKIVNLEQAKHLVGIADNLMSKRFNVVVYNFVDTLSHARTDSKIMRELAEDEVAYRSLTKSWFDHSPLLEFIKKISAHKVKLVITTDHGSVRVKNPVKVIGDKQTSTNLRYKTGKKLSYNRKEVAETTKPRHFKLPQKNLSSSFIFAKSNDFLVYPNNMNHFIKYYDQTFQHGGISMEEMLIPFITLRSK